MQGATRGHTHCCALATGVRISRRGRIFGARLAVGALWLSACAPQCNLISFPLPTPCSPGTVSLGLACSGYSGTAVCQVDGGFTDPCSGGPCCDPGFFPTAVTAQGSSFDYGGCRPGPS